MCLFSNLTTLSSEYTPFCPQINNAGVLVLEWTKENFDKTIQTNLSGPVLLTRALEPHFNNGALIINVSSCEDTAGAMVLIWD